MNVFQYTGPGDDQVLWIACDDKAQADAFAAQHGWPSGHRIDEFCGNELGIDVRLHADGTAETLESQPLGYTDRA